MNQNNTSISRRRLFENKNNEQQMFRHLIRSVKTRLNFVKSFDGKCRKNIVDKLTVLVTSKVGFITRHYYVNDNLCGDFGMIVLL